MKRNRIKIVAKCLILIMLFSTMPLWTLIKAEETAAEPYYSIKVTDGIACAEDGTPIESAQTGESVSIKANEAPEGKVFWKWDVIKGTCVLEDVYAASTSFVMTAKYTELQAVYRSIDSTNKVTMEYICQDSVMTKSYEYEKGTLVTFSGWVFDNTGMDGKSFYCWEDQETLEEKFHNNYIFIEKDMVFKAIYISFEDRIQIPIYSMGEKVRDFSVVRGRDTVLPHSGDFFVKPFNKIFVRYDINGAEHKPGDVVRFNGDENFEIIWRDDKTPNTLTLKNVYGKSATLGGEIPYGSTGTNSMPVIEGEELFFYPTLYYDEKDPMESYRYYFKGWKVIADGDVKFSEGTGWLPVAYLKMPDFDVTIEAEYEKIPEEYVVVEFNCNFDPHGYLGELYNFSGDKIALTRTPNGIIMAVPEGSSWISEGLYDNFDKWTVEAANFDDNLQEKTDVTSEALYNHDPENYNSKFRLPSKRYDYVRFNASYNETDYKGMAKVTVMPGEAEGKPVLLQYNVGALVDIDKAVSFIPPVGKMIVGWRCNGYDYDRKQKIMIREPEVTITAIWGPCDHPQEILINEKDPVSCTEYGYTGDKQCFNCKEITFKGREIPMLHKWKDATCLKAKYCKECGEISGEPLGHKFEPYMVREESTETTEGIMIMRCSCGARVEEAIPKKEAVLVDELKFAKKKIKIKKGKKATVKVKIAPALKEISKSERKVRWSIDKKGKKVITFVKKASSYTGKLSVKVKAKKKGKATVTCAAPSGKKASCIVIVK